MLLYVNKIRIQDLKQECELKLTKHISELYKHFQTSRNYSLIAGQLEKNTSPKKGKQIDLKTKEINSQIAKKFHLSIENKLLTYKAVIKPIWSYGIELWGCASKSSIVIVHRSQSKILRATVNSSWFVTNHTLHTDFNIPYVNDVIHEGINKHHNKLEAHSNPLSEALLQPVNTRRLKRCWHLDLPGT